MTFVIPVQATPEGQSELTLKIENVWQAGVQGSWRDSPSRRLEDRLNDVFARLYRVAHALNVKARKDAERQRKVDAENARRAALWQERESEAKFLTQLEADAKGAAGDLSHASRACSASDR